VVEAAGVVAETVEDVVAVDVVASREIHHLLLPLPPRPPLINTILNIGVLSSTLRKTMTYHHGLVTKFCHSFLAISICLPFA
jgi:hypothetical protein